ncbi:unnamed protein product [Mesocestoides corti]|uniref:Uncharacterized protein n=1 Tax=Mesocestoides corti TaxID=53468 RepID=A0A0R3UGB5_MESCO|nr:unnamed protein product [Mesocestoides corti]
MLDRFTMSFDHCRILTLSSTTLVSRVEFAHVYLYLGCVSHKCANIETYACGYSKINIRANEGGVEDSGTLCWRLDDRIKGLNKHDSRHTHLYRLAIFTRTVVCSLKQQTTLPVVEVVNYAGHIFVSLLRLHGTSVYVVFSKLNEYLKMRTLSEVWRLFQIATLSSGSVAFIFFTSITQNSKVHQVRERIEECSSILDEQHIIFMALYFG